MSIRDALVRLSGSSLISALLQLGNGVLLARMLGPDGRGFYGELVFWAMTVNSLTNFAIFDAAMVRLRDKALEWNAEVGSLALFTLATTLLNVAVLAGIFVYGLESGRTLLPDELWALAGYGVIVNVVLMLGALERARLEFRTLAFERMLTPFAYTVLLLAAAIHGTDARTAFLLLIAANLPVLGLRLWRNARYIGVRLTGSSLNAAARLSLRFFSVAAVLVVVNQIDKGIVLATFDPATAGQYFVGFSLAGAAFGLIYTALQTVMLPALIGIEPARRAVRLERCARLALLGSLALAGAIALFARPIVLIAFGARYEAAIGYSVWVAMAMALMPLMGLMESANMALARNRQAIELHLIVIAGLTIAWLTGELTSVERLCAVYLLARTIAVVAGFRHLVRAPFGVRLAHCLLPQKDDWQDLRDLWDRLRARRLDGID